MGNYVTNVLHKLSNGRYCAIEYRILMIGLDGAGKTTILYKMKLGEIVTTIPTIGFNVETLNIGGVNLTTWDVGSWEKMRPLWRHYYPNTAALIFIVDSTDRERIEEAADLFNNQIKEDELRDTVVLVIANKQDLSDALSVAEIAETFKLHTIKHKCNILPTSATTGAGLNEAFHWLVDALTDGGTTHSSHLQKNADKNETIQNSWTEWFKSFLKPISNGKRTEMLNTNSDAKT